jgi:hypothetical protein
MSLSPASIEKLLEMLSGYDEAIATAKELDPDVEILPLNKVCKALLKLGAEKLQAIAEFGQPTLILTPNNTFAKKRENMNKNKKYVDKDGDTQNDLETYDEPYNTISTPTKNTFSVVDGQPHMPHIPGIAPNTRFDNRKKKFLEYFQQKGLRLINIHEFAALEQRSLRDFQKSGNDVTKIVDFYQGGSKDTISCLDDEHLTPSSLVAFGYFRSDFREVNFDASRPGVTDGDLRARPSVQVCSY